MMAGGGMLWGTWREGEEKDLEERKTHDGGGHDLANLEGGGGGGKGLGGEKSAEPMGEDADSRSGEAQDIGKGQDLGEEKAKFCSMLYVSLPSRNHRFYLNSL